MKTEVIDIDEMRKWSWATTYEKEVKKLPGVTSAIADFDAKKLAVEFDEKVVGLPAIMEKVNEVRSRFLNKGFVKT